MFWSPSKKTLKIEKCNARIAFSKPQKEETYQVTLEALKLSPCYPAFVITAEVPEIYMHQFWNNIKKIGNTDAYNFKLDKKKYRVDTEPWRTFAAVINKCISGKTTGLDRLSKSRAQILWAMYNQINVDYVALLWEYFMYLADNREISSARKEHMPYLKFTKVIINHFISKDNAISMRNKVNLHTVRDDTLLTFKTYLDFATGKVPPKKVRKYKKHVSPKLKTVPASPKEPTQKEVPDEPTCKTKDTSKGTSVKLKVPDVSKADSSDRNDDSWGDSKDESDDVHDKDDNNDDDDDENPYFTLKDYEEEEQDEEYLHTLKKDKSDDEEKMYEGEEDDVAKELYGDLNITQGLKDTDMTNAEQGRADQQNASHEYGFVDEEEDALVTLTTLHDKTEGPFQSFFVSSDFTSKLLDLDDPSPDFNSLMNTSTIPPSPPPNRRDLPRDIPLDSVVVLSETVTPWFTLTVLSALRRSDDENILRIYKDGHGGT
nr:hypothetical protein [Tanacetum cinerariifolium]